jgi:chromatin remodeling complex protein RSC6
MARQTKTTKASTESVSTVPAITVSASASTSTVVAEKKVKAPRASKATTESKTVAPAAASTSVPATTEATTEAVEFSETPLAEQSIEFIAKLQQISSMISSLKTEYKNLEKKWSRELKANQKASKKKRKSGNRAPSGFVKPTKISNELASFLEKPEGTEMARTSVTRDINAYIRTHNLQDKDNGRKINPDKKLSTLLKLSSSDELTYFNLQKYMSPHFAKIVKPDQPAYVAVAGVTF